MSKSSSNKPVAPIVYPEQARGLNNFLHDRNLARYLQRHYPDMLKRQQKTLESLGDFCSGRLDEQAEYSDRAAPPRLVRSLDRTVAPQARKTSVVLNDDYKDCQQELYRHGVIAKCFDPQQPEPQMLPFIAQYMTSYTDISTGCPLAMTHPDALVLATRAPADIRDRFLPQFLRTDGKTMIGGTWATEWAGGSDVKGNTKTSAHPIIGERVLLFGKNFFTSAMGFDSWGAMKTVRLQRGNGNGIALVFVTRFEDEKWDAPESARKLNNVTVTHLKEKSGTEGLATAEIELDGATGYLVADEKNGLRVMMEALGCSRVHNAMAAAGVMHRAYVEAMCWASNRSTFGGKLTSRPDMQDDLLKLKTEWLGGAALAFEAARTFDAAQGDKARQAWLRVVTALAKYRTAEKATECTALATEIVGGIGYTKDHPIERINRDAMVLRVWEGPKNIQARDLMYVLANGGAQAFLKRLDGIAADIDKILPTEKWKLGTVRRHMGEALENLAKQPEQTDRLGPFFLREMSTALTYALLCEEAAQEIIHDNDKSKLLVAQAFYKENCEEGFNARMKQGALHEQFNAIAAGLPVPARGPSKEDKPASAHPKPKEP